MCLTWVCYVGTMRMCYMGVLRGGHACVLHGCVTWGPCVCVTWVCYKGMYHLKELSVKTYKNPIYVAEGGITAGVTVHTMLTHLLEGMLVRGNR